MNTFIALMKIKQLKSLLFLMGISVLFIYHGTSPRQTI